MKTTHYSITTLTLLTPTDTTQKMKFSFRDFFSKCEQIQSNLRIWPHLLKKFLMKNCIFCAVQVISRPNKAKDE